MRDGAAGGNTGGDSLADSPGKASRGNVPDSVRYMLDHSLPAQLSARKASVVQQAVAIEPAELRIDMGAEKKRHKKLDLGSCLSPTGAVLVVCFCTFMFSFLVLCTKFRGTYMSSIWATAQNSGPMWALS